jgi:chromosome segregation ATPase
MLTSFDSSLPQRDVSEDVTPVFPDEEAEQGLSWIKQEARDLQKRVNGLVTRFKDESEVKDSFFTGSDESLNFRSLFLNESSTSTRKVAQIIAKVEGMAFEIEKLAGTLEAKEQDLERMNAENSLLQRKLTRLNEVMKKYEDPVSIAVERLEDIPSCEKCALL